MMQVAGGRWQVANYPDYSNSIELWLCACSCARQTALRHIRYSRADADARYCRDAVCALHAMGLDSAEMRGDQSIICVAYTFVSGDGLWGRLCLVE
jgi:hypothetical protein